MHFFLLVYTLGILCRKLAWVGSDTMVLCVCTFVIQFGRVNKVLEGFVIGSPIQ